MSNRHSNKRTSKNKRSTCGAHRGLTTAPVGGSLQDLPSLQADLRFIDDTLVLSLIIVDRTSPR